MRHYLTTGELIQFLSHLPDDTTIVLDKTDYQMDLGPKRLAKAVDLSEIYDGLMDAKAQALLNR